MKRTLSLVLSMLMVSGCEFLERSVHISNAGGQTVGTTGSEKATVVLSWDESSGLPQSYLVEQSTDNVHFSLVQTVSVPLVQIRNLVPAQYYFRVRASNAVGTSGYSAVISINLEE